MLPTYKTFSAMFLSKSAKVGIFSSKLPDRLRCVSATFFSTLGNSASQLLCKNLN